MVVGFRPPGPSSAGSVIVPQGPAGCHVRRARNLPAILASPRPGSTACLPDTSAGPAVPLPTPAVCPVIISPPAAESADSLADERPPATFLPHGTESKPPAARPRGHRRRG